MFDPSLKKKKKKKKTGFDLDAALGGESGYWGPPAQEEQKNEQVSAPVSEKIDVSGGIIKLKFSCVRLLEVHTILLRYLANGTLDFVCVSHY